MKEEALVAPRGVCCSHRGLSFSAPCCHSVTVCYKIIIMIIIRTIMQSGPVYIKQLLRQVVTSGLLPVYLHPYSS